MNNKYKHHVNDYLDALEDEELYDEFEEQFQSVVKIRKSNKKEIEN